MKKEKVWGVKSKSSGKHKCTLPLSAHTSVHSAYLFGHQLTSCFLSGWQNGRWNNCDLDALNVACKVEVAYDQVPVSSAEPCLSSFAPLSEICPSMSNGNSMEDNHQANPGIGMPMQGLPKRTGFDVVPCPDRDSVISRYKAKRKTRR